MAEKNGGVLIHLNSSFSIMKSAFSLGLVQFCKRVWFPIALWTYGQLLVEAILFWAQ